MRARLEEATAVRTQLHRAGYAPIPLDGKRPQLKDWTAKTATTEAEIGLWAKLYPTGTNTGILTRSTPALDIDIMDAGAAEAIEELARERFEERGYFMVRIGMAPKRAVLLRTDAPFRKVAVTLTAANGGTGHRIEVLGNGQQVVVDGIHPDTNAPYCWHGGRPGEVPWSDLPGISAGEAQTFVADATALLAREFGYRLGPASPRVMPCHGGGMSAVDWATMISTHVSEGGRNDTVARVTGHLLRRGIHASVVNKFMQWWNSAHCRPPLLPAEITRTVDSICRAELRRWHHV
jgi:hypothetical protein